MSQYIIRKGKFGHEIAKFNDTTTSLDTYNISSRGCSCPAYSRSCKHTRILKKWMKNKIEGTVYDDDAQEISNIFNFNISSNTSKSRICS